MRGDEYIVGQTAHTYRWEGGGAAVLGSIQPQPLDFEKDGTLPLDKVANAIKMIDDHHPRTRLLCLENTTGGKVLPLSYLKQVNLFCRERGLASHLDGARVFNAVAHLQCQLKDITMHFDSVSICLSKGLGAPIGSVLCGSKAFIQKARRWRKVLGGGMRQVGIIAAAGIYALENNTQRLREDHDNAATLAKALSEIEALDVDLDSLHTNMFFMKKPKDWVALVEHLKNKNILIDAKYSGDRIRFVTHLDVSADDIQTVVMEIKAFYSLRN